MDFQPMKLEERHKEFAVKCYAKFMKRSEIINAFVEEFVTDIATAYRETSKSKMSQALVEELMPEAAQKTQSEFSLKNGMEKVQMLMNLREYLVQLKANLADRLRRLNITHCQFPEKYRDLFNQTRNEYFTSYQTENLQNPDNIIIELETLYGYVKQRVFQEASPEEAMKHLTLAHNVLKTIATYNAINAQQEIVDGTPQKQLTET